MSNKAKIGMVSLVREEGHINTMLTLARRLKEEGFEISILGLADDRDHFESLGFRYVTFCENTWKAGDRERIRNSKRPWLQIKKLGAAIKQFPEEIEKLSEFSLIIGDTMAQVDLLMAHKKSIQCVLIQNPIAWRNIDILPSHWTTVLPKRDGTLSWKTKFNKFIGFDDYLRHPLKLVRLFFLWVYGLRPMAIAKSFFPTSNYNSEWLRWQRTHTVTLVPCPIEFDFPHYPSPNKFYVDAFIDRSRLNEKFDWNRIPEGKKIVYTAFGSQGQSLKKAKLLFDKTIAAVKDNTQLHLIISLSGVLTPSSFDRVPSNVTLLKWAPQLVLLERAALMINQGGFNSVKECIYTGTPMLAIPIFRDHPGTAARIVYHGLGLALDYNKVTAEKIRQSIDELLVNPMYSMRINKMREVFKAAETRNEAVDVVKRFLDLALVLGDKEDRPQPGKDR
ncbi:glycosyltransferase [Thermodesulfobacteriota bacterium]